MVIQRQQLGLVVLLKHVVYGSPKIPILFLSVCGCVFLSQDPLTTVREQCEQLEKYVKARERLELCDERVSSRSQTEEDCTEELFDFLHARDHCVSPPKVRKGKAYSGQGRLGDDHLSFHPRGRTVLSILHT